MDRYDGHDGYGAYEYEYDMYRDMDVCKTVMDMMDEKDRYSHSIF